MGTSSCGDSWDCVDPVNEVGNTLARALHISIEQPNANANANDQTSVLSLPSASNLVSAMKGGRGAEPRKQRVSWAASVYDPTPTSMSHTVTTKKQHKPKNHKKTSKKSHKGKSSKNSRRVIKHTDNDDDADSPSYCGTSFFKKSLANTHYPLAEAL